MSQTLRARLGAILSWRVLGLSLGLVAGLGLVGLAFSVEMSSRPAFCGSCHVMAPYYQSWVTSSHKNVACVECHIPPGVTAEIRKKYEALSMVARYFTGTYSTNPWAEVDDAACLRCHERRLLTGKELFGDVLFDHAAHLAGMRRGKTLRCTSCHGQIVQGSHIAVTGSTCILCHFKGQTAGEGQARCTLCHNVPDKVIQQGTLTFNHSDVGRFGMTCTWCHARPAGTDGAVPKERCVTCHNEPSRLERYDEVDELHHQHVTEHKVDCLNCHLEIQHVGPPRLEQAVESCDSCHKSGHSPQLNLYTGVGGRGVEPMPSVMFSAGVRCEGCHIALPGQPNDVHRANDVSCMSCHGPSYRNLLQAWRQGVESRTAALEAQLAATERTAAGRPGEGPLADARFNLDLVTRGHGVHNVPYAMALLDRAHEYMNQAREAGGLPPLARPWPAAGAGGACMTCHTGIEGQAGQVFGRSFVHGPHVIDGKLACTACHRPHEERPKTEVLRFGAAGCESCHHSDAKRDCLSCHGSIKTRKVKSPLGAFDHAFHLDEAEQTCADCHQMQSGAAPTLKTGTCDACHGK